MFSLFSLRLSATSLALPRSLLRPGVTRFLSTSAPPKHPIGAFFLYVKENRELTQNITPKATLTDITKTLGSAWRNMTDADKKPYLDRANEDKSKYDTALKAYNDSLTPEQKAALAALKEKAKKDAVKAKAAKEKRQLHLKEKAEGLPKRPTSALFYYLKDSREAIKRANPTAKVTEITKIGVQQYKNLSPAERQKYEDLAAADKSRYTKEMEEWRKTHPKAKKPPTPEQLAKKAAAEKAKKAAAEKRLRLKEKAAAEKEKQKKKTAAKKEKMKKKAEAEKEKLKKKVEAEKLKEKEKKARIAAAEKEKKRVLAERQAEAKRAAEMERRAKIAAAEKARKKAEAAKKKAAAVKTMTRKTAAAPAKKKVAGKSKRASAATGGKKVVGKTVKRSAPAKK